MVVVINSQREAPVNVRKIRQLARRALRRLRVKTHGDIVVTFASTRHIRALNRRFVGRDRVTDVLSFRYEGEPTAGDIVVAPLEARRYAKRHQLSYEQELGRYVVHGLLHWLGYDDRTQAQQRSMRAREDRLLAG